MKTPRPYATGGELPPEVVTFPRKPETSAQAITRQEIELRAKARLVAREIHNDADHLSLDLAQACAMNSLPPGVRDIYRRLSAHIDQEIANVTAILGRVE